MLTSIIRVKFGGRFVVAHLAGGAALFEVAQAGLVAMMPVGDEHGLGTEQAGDDADDVLIGDGPQTADDAEMVGSLQRQCPADQGVELGHDLVLGIGVEAEHRTEVHAGGVEQFQTVGLGSGHRLLVRIDAAGAERLQADAGQKAAARVADSLDLEVLIVGVHAASGILHENVVALPVAQAAGGAACSGSPSPISVGSSLLRMRRMTL